MPFRLSAELLSLTRAPPSEGLAAQMGLELGVPGAEAASSLEHARTWQWLPLLVGSVPAHPGLVQCA